MKLTASVPLLLSTIALAAIAAPMHKRGDRDSLLAIPINIDANHAVDGEHVADHWNWNQLTSGTIYAPVDKRGDGGNLLTIPINVDANHAVDGEHVADHWNWNQLTSDTTYAPRKRGDGGSLGDSLGDSLLTIPINVDANHAVDGEHVADHWNWNQLTSDTTYAPRKRGDRGSLGGSFGDSLEGSRGDSLLNIPINMDANHAVDGEHVADHWNWNQLTAETIYAPEQR